MKRRLAISFCAWVLPALAACSSAVLQIGTPEEDLISKGSTLSELEKKLGPPISTVPMSPPELARDIPRMYPRVTLLVPPTFQQGADGTLTLQHSKERVTSELHYRFIGRLARRGESGEAASLAIMSMGLSEVVGVPAAVAARSKQEEYRLQVWASEAGEVLAYRWHRLA